MRSLLIDNYDSYTYNLYQLLSVVNGCEALVVPNDISWDALSALEFDNIVISPGPGHPGEPKDFGVCGEALARATVPVLGVCLGHQGIALAYGGALAIGDHIIHGQRSRILHDGGPLFVGVPQHFWAVRYHSLLAVKPVPAGLRTIAWTDEGAVMGLAALDKPVYGVQFHPESCMTEYGERILENFRDITLARPDASFLVRGDEEEPISPAPPAPAKRERESVRVFTERVPGAVDVEALFAHLRGNGHIAWLDSARRGVDTGRYSYIASAGGALGEIVRYDQATRTCRASRAGRTRVFADTSIFTYLAENHARYEIVMPPAFPAGLPFGFCGGYIGWIGYECKAEGGFPGTHAAETDDAALLFADRLLVIDHDCDDVTLVTLVDAGGDEQARAWMEATRELVVRVQKAPSQPLEAAQGTASARPFRTKEEYLRDIARCQEELRRGESYQVCLSNQFAVESDIEPFEAYRRLRRANPAPYAAYLDFGETQAACSSPERFLRVTRSGIVEARPIKGTAPRHANPVRDAELALALARDVKETAENLMIVDLLRNDLGRVCTIGSVHVPSLMAIESFETVHQIVSTIRGELRAGASAVDCLRACFPAGSMTGAPKLRATRAIDELEIAGRGIYSGVLGYMGVDGAAEFNVVIRTLVRHRGRITVGAGGGITVLSDGEREWNEVVLKAKSVLNALGANVTEE